MSRDTKPLFFIYVAIAFLLTNIILFVWKKSLSSIIVLNIMLIAYVVFQYWIFKGDYSSEPKNWREIFNDELNQKTLDKIRKKIHPTLYYIIVFMFIIIYADCAVKMK